MIIYDDTLNSFFQNCWEILIHLYPVPYPSLSIRQQLKWMQIHTDQDSQPCKKMASQRPKVPSEYHISLSPTEDLTPQHISWREGPHLSYQLWAKPSADGPHLSYQLWATAISWWSPTWVISCEQQPSADGPHLSYQLWATAISCWSPLELSAVSNSNQLMVPTWVISCEQQPASPAQKAVSSWYRPAAHLSLPPPTQESFFNGETRKYPVCRERFILPHKEGAQAPEPKCSDTQEG